MKKYDDASTIRVIMFILSFSFILVSFIIFLHENNNIIESNKDKVSNGLLGGSLALLSISLSVLAYSFSKIQTMNIYKEKEPYEKLANIMYFIILLSLSETSTLIIYLLFGNWVFFILSLVLIYILFITLSIALVLWMQKELTW
jgi:uncharacterized membrane protein YidH (DUF202 family)